VDARAKAVARTARYASPGIAGQAAYCRGADPGHDVASALLQAQLDDLIAFALARQEGGILLTGDRDLRQTIESERRRIDGAPVEIHATFWLIELMLTDGAITDAEARTSVVRMKQCKRRLP
jgi:hypothetical protein